MIFEVLILNYSFYYDIIHTMITWDIEETKESVKTSDDIIKMLLQNRGIIGKKEKENFIHPPHPLSLTPKDVGIDPEKFREAVTRIRRAVKDHESIVVYSDYDADGITSGAILWEALFHLGARVMPYVPGRIEEGYGLSEKGILAVKETFEATLIITVDHGINAKNEVEFAKKEGIDVVVTDHHTVGKKVPSCPTIHTTSLCGAGVSWMLASHLLGKEFERKSEELLSLAAIGTIADMVQLTHANRAIVFHGIEEIRKTKRLGLLALIKNAGIEKDTISSYQISHMLVPRINAMGRITHALDALRLLCTTNEKRAEELASHVGLTNQERQQLTIDTVSHADEIVQTVYGKTIVEKLILISHESYNQGIIGLVAGKLMERYVRPAVVIAKGDIISKASCRSIPGFNIVEAVRKCEELVIDVGGHPMAAGFTVETKNIGKLMKKLTGIANDSITDDMLVQRLSIDMALPLSLVSEKLWNALRVLEPFGFGNREPIFASLGVIVDDVRSVGAEKRHAKLRVHDETKQGVNYDAIFFNGFSKCKDFTRGDSIDVAYTIDMNEWNDQRKVQLKIRDIEKSTKKSP